MVLYLNLVSFSDVTVSHLSRPQTQSWWQGDGFHSRRGEEMGSAVLKLWGLLLLPWEEEEKLPFGRYGESSGDWKSPVTTDCHPCVWVGSRWPGVPICPSPTSRSLEQSLFLSSCDRRSSVWIHLHDVCVPQLRTHFWTSLNLLSLVSFVLSLKSTGFVLSLKAKQDPAPLGFRQNE